MPAQAKYCNSLAFTMFDYSLFIVLKWNASIKSKAKKKRKNQKKPKIINIIEQIGEKMRVVLMKSQRIDWKFSILIDQSHTDDRAHSYANKNVACNIFFVVFFFLTSFGFALFRCLLMNRKRKSIKKTPKKLFIITIELTYRTPNQRNSINIKNTQS